jgi:transposase
MSFDPEKPVERLEPAAGYDSTLRYHYYMVDIEDGRYVRYSDYKDVRDAWDRSYILVEKMKAERDAIEKKYAAQTLTLMAANDILRRGI